MSDIFDNLGGKFQDISTKISKEGKRYLKSAVSKGEELGQKGKIQIEIEKLKWELRQKHTALGKYVAEIKISKSVTDFSHDSQFLDQINEIYKLRLYIDERKQGKGDDK